MKRTNKLTLTLCVPCPPTGCLPLLIQLLHGSDKDSGLLGNTRGSAAARARASAALHNIVHSNPDDKRGRREARTLRLLEQIRAHCDQQRGETASEEEEEEEDGEGEGEAGGGAGGWWWWFFLSGMVYLREFEESFCCQSELECRYLSPTHPLSLAREEMKYCTKTTF